jgi:hypothetical protein
LPEGFNFFVSSTLESASVQMSGCIQTRDELDAVVTVLQVFRAWISPAQGIEAAPADETRSGSAEGESPVPERHAPKASPDPLGLEPKG